VSYGTSPVQLDPVSYLTNMQPGFCDYLRFPGNYGDSLIWHGTKLLLGKASVQYRTIGCSETPGAEYLIVDGGGNLTDLYTDVSDFLDNYGDSYSHILVLPHTVAGARPLASLRRLGSRLTIFCREYVSWLNVSMGAPRSSCYLWHDCAFNLNLCRNTLATSQDHSFYAFRADVEATRNVYPPGNRDISLEGYAQSKLDMLIDSLSCHSMVVTDRLHIAIAACLLGCNVELHPNSYFKNKAVYEYSLRDRGNITFVG
jgi:exopolysaccharide biosynthesis predicted pyruvyltransferase EpsI